MNKKYQQQGHTDSYYAASAIEKTNYPELKGSHSADICIVGAGFTGIATALTLAERGYSVAVVEANRIGWGASGRNGGQLINGIGGLSKVSKKYGPAYDEILWDLKWRGNDIIIDRVSQYGIDCDLKQGFIEVAVKQRQVEDLREENELYTSKNFPHEFRFYDQEEMSSVLGSDLYLGGFVNYRDGHLHPLNLCIGEAHAAATLGAQIFEQSPVTRIVHGKKARVETLHGHVEADSVVLAGNAYHALERRHLGGLTFPAGSYIIGTEPLSPEIVEQINPLDLAVCDLNLIVDYFRLSADKRMLYGGSCNYSGRDPSSIKDYIVPRMLKAYPQLKDVRIDYEWGGQIGIVVNRIPALGRINGNVYYAQGYSGHGVNATHIMGELVADAIGGTMEKFDLFAKMNHFRIPGSQWFGNQMIALGMLYYRLKDAL